MQMIIIWIPHIQEEGITLLSLLNPVLFQTESVVFLRKYNTLHLPPPKEKPIFSVTILPIVLDIFSISSTVYGQPDKIGTIYIEVMKLFNEVVLLRPK